MDGGGRDKQARPRKGGLSEALGVLIGNTRRVHRKFSLVDVAECIEIARQDLGSLHAVAEHVGLSEEMLRQFGSVKDLCPKVKKLVSERKIDSVDIVYRLSKLPHSEQYDVASLVAGGDLDSDDVRAVVTLRRSAPEIDIREVVERVRSSRNIKEYVAYFPVPAGRSHVRLLRSAVAAVVGQANIRSLSLEGNLGTLILNSAGRKRLAEAARSQGVTTRRLLDRIVREWRRRQ
jgi:hypothetical protein